jgi:DNA-binding IclR family transcriptional regulator
VPNAPGLVRNQSLQRGAALLGALSDDRAGTPATGLAERVGLPLPTVRRLLATLADAGLAEQVPGTSLWVLGHELVRLGRRADPYVAVVTQARPRLELLASELGEAVILGADRLPHAVDVIAQVDPPRMVGIGSWVGRGFGLHASAGARLALASRSDDDVRVLLGPGPLHRYTAATIVEPERFLADVRRVRERGYAVSVDELEEGLATVAVPVGPLGPDHVFSIGVSGPAFRLDRARRESALGSLRSAAAAIAAAITR